MVGSAADSAIRIAMPSGSCAPFRAFGNFSRSCEQQYMSEARLHANKLIGLPEFKAPRITRN